MMIKTFYTTIWLLLLLSSAAAQDYSTPSESRKEQLRDILDYRYRGGFYTFEKDFITTVEYPEAAMQNCVMGIVLVAIHVNCEGKVVQIAMRNSVKFGIDEQITQFFNTTSQNWNKCDDEKYTKFEIPVQFKISGTETNNTDALIVKEDKLTGTICNDDEYYLTRAEKALKKKKGKRALELINQLILRDPYNARLYEMKKEAFTYIK